VRLAAARAVFARAHGHPTLSRAVILALLAAVVCSCGAHRTAAGKAIFDRDCASCHTLDGREHGAVGGDLVVANLGVRALASFARVMPVHPRLDAREANAVARYVQAVASDR
jgi:mono/diheme cytochrome c family protein